MEIFKEDKEVWKEFNEHKKKSVLRSSGSQGVIPIRIGTLPLEVQNHIMRLKRNKQMGEWIRTAMIHEFQFQYRPKAFIIEIIRNNFVLCRNLLRQIGNQIQADKIYKTEPIDKWDYRGES